MIDNKNKILKTINKDFKNNNITSIFDVLNKISSHYDVFEPEIINANLGYDLEIEINDKKFLYKTLKITIGMNDEDSILVEPKGNDFVDVFKINNNGSILPNKRIYKNISDNSVIEKIFLNKGTIKYNKNDNIIYHKYVYHLKNDNLDTKIKIIIPTNIPFVENLFIKKILENSLIIKDIDNLFSVIKANLKIDKACIRLENIKDNDKEYIDFRFKKLMEYKRITDNKILEYKDGYDRLLVTEFKSESLESDEFKKVINLIRS